MKTSTISSMSIQNALRYTVRQSQNELAKAEKEATSGQYQDIGIALGARTTQSIDLSGEVLRIQGLKDNNSIVTQRLDSSQAALTDMSKQADSILASIIALGSYSDPTKIKTSVDTISGAFQAFTSSANTSLNGEYLFSGINTDVKPLADFYDPAGSTPKTAYNTAINGYLTANGLSSVSQMTGPQMDDFITNTLTPMFTGANWTSDWSSATNQNMTSRVNRNEIIETSANTNAAGIRNMALASVISTELLGQNLSNDARAAAVKQATAVAGQAITGINEVRSKLGLSQSRVTAANTSLDAQKDIIETHLSDLTGVDGYEASTRVTNLKALVEACYSMTAQLQQMSLVNFLK